MSLLSPLCEVLDQRAKACGIFLGVPKSNIARTAQKISGTTSSVIVVGMKPPKRSFPAHSTTALLRGVLGFVFFWREACSFLSSSRRKLCLTGCADLLSLWRGAQSAHSTQPSRMTKIADAIRRLSAIVSRSLSFWSISSTAASSSRSVFFPLGVAFCEAGDAEFPCAIANMAAATPAFLSATFAEVAVLASGTLRTALSLFSDSARRTDRHGFQSTALIGNQQVERVGWEPAEGHNDTRWVVEE